MLQIFPYHISTDSTICLDFEDYIAFSTNLFPFIIKIKFNSKKKTYYVKTINIGEFIMNQEDFLEFQSIKYLLVE